jgi:deazaflavin-dependent oxidoreductase (nitroreductase family)
MSALRRWWDRIGGSILTRLGRAGYLTTTGRRSGRSRRTHLGVVRRPDGSFLVGAGGVGRHWAANLRADPACTLDLRGIGHPCRATELQGRERDLALAEMRAAMGRFGERARFVEVFLLSPRDGAA